MYNSTFLLHMKTILYFSYIYLEATPLMQRMDSITSYFSCTYDANTHAVGLGRAIDYR